MKYNFMIDTSHITVAEDTLRAVADAIETYRKVSMVNIADSLTGVTNAFSVFSQIKYSESLESLRAVTAAFTKISIPNIENDLHFDEIRKSIQIFSETVKVYQHVNATESLEAIRKSFNTVFDNFEIEQIERFQHINYSALFADILPRATSISDMVETAYVRIEGEIEEETNFSDSFTEEEIKESLKEQVANSLKFQERVANWTEKKKKEYFLVFVFIFFVYSIFVEPYVQEHIGKPVMTYVVSNVKELPQKGAEVIGKIKENMEAIIIENTNYYYKVVYIDENGERKEGYVAKRNLKIINEEPEREEASSTEGEETDFLEE